MDHLHSLHHRGAVWSLIFVYYCAKFIFISIMLGWLYFDLRRSLKSLEFSKLDLFSIHTGLGFFQISLLLKGLGNAATKQETLITDKIAESNPYQKIGSTQIMTSNSNLNYKVKVQKLGKHSRKDSEKEPELLFSPGESERSDYSSDPHKFSSISQSIFSPKR
jgi:hypothetical protein